MVFWEGVELFVTIYGCMCVTVYCYDGVGGVSPLSNGERDPIIRKIKSLDGALVQPFSLSTVIL